MSFLNKVAPPIEISRPSPKGNTTKTLTRVLRAVSIVYFTLLLVVVLADQSLTVLIFAFPYFAPLACVWLQDRPARLYWGVAVFSLVVLVLQVALIFGPSDGTGGLSYVYGVLYFGVYVFALSIGVCLLAIKENT